VVLLAGASGSGKTRVSRRAGVPTLALDDFYRDRDDPALGGRSPEAVDWDDPATWDAAAAADALEALCHEGVAEVPDYDIPGSRRAGSHRVELGGSPIVVAEGIFAAELVAPLTERLLLAEALYLRRHRASTFVRRLARDLLEGRKAPWTLVARGVRLTRREPELRQRWDRLGCAPASRSRVEHVLRTSAAAGDVPRARLHRSVDHLTHLRRAVDDVAAALTTVDLTTPVPTCPGWTVADLVGHLGAVQRWATTAVTEQRGDGEFGAAPTDAEELAAWFRTGAADLLKALVAADAADPAWTFGDPRAVAFWIRRQTHEAVVHSWDLRAAVGTPDRLPPDLAEDGLDETVTMFWPRQVRKGRASPPQRALALALPDGRRRWIVGDRGDPGLPVAATVTGPADALLLLMWHRLPLDDPRLSVSGEFDAVTEALDRALTP
jgi:uridine kinase